MERSISGLLWERNGFTAASATVRKELFAWSQRTALIYRGAREERGNHGPGHQNDNEGPGGAFAALVSQRKEAQSRFEEDEPPKTDVALSPSSHRKVK